MITTAYINLHKDYLLASNIPDLEEKVLISNNATINVLAFKHSEPKESWSTKYGTQFLLMLVTSMNLNPNSCTFIHSEPYHLTSAKSEPISFLILRNIYACYIILVSSRTW